MKFFRIFLPALLFIPVCLLGTVVFKSGFCIAGAPPQENVDEKVPHRNLYDKLDIGDVVTYAAFDCAMQGYETLKAGKKNMLVVIDFTKPSTQERLCVIDMEKARPLHTSHVAHGQGSGGNYATSFSNKPGSHQSSLGFYVTGETYQGGNGYSLILYGLEKGINDKARERSIVIHGADYCDPAIIEMAGRLGRSWGCPALPKEKNRPIIDTIKEGALLYIHSDDQSYLAMSTVFGGKRPV